MSSDLEPMPITPQKHDPAWQHCQMFKNEEKVQLKCLYCGKLFKGGGIHRIKEHLAGQKGNASTCLRVSSDVRALMLESLNGFVVKKRKKQKIAEEITNASPICGASDTFANQHGAESGLQSVGVADTLVPSSSFLVNREESTPVGNRRKRGKAKNPPNATPLDLSLTGFAAKRVDNHAHMAIGRFLFDIGAPLDAVNSAYFQPMVDAIASAGPGAVMPSYNDLRGWILKKSVEEVKSDMERLKAAWGRNGCSVLFNQRNSETGRTFLEFFVYCSEGTVFLKSVDASGVINSSDALYELLKQVVEEVGVKNVLQVITNDEQKYLIAGKRLSDTFPLYWTPCAAHCIDLILEDFSKLDWINAVIEQARSITRFVYNNSVVLNMVRRHTFGYDIVDRGVTRSSTNFATLNRMVSLKHNLQTMVTSNEWMDSLYSKKLEGLEMLDLISNQSFWSSCALITQITNPLLRVLRMVGSEKRPAMGYVYAGMYRAKEAIKKELVKRDDYMVYWSIIDRWWDQHWHYPLHAAGFYLNPKFFYSIQGDIPNEILSGLFDSVERLVPDIQVQDKIMKEINKYKNALGDFGRSMTIRARETLLPEEWWSTYGGSCPNLARLALRILNQTCSSFGLKQKQIPLEQLNDTRNCLEHQWLRDLAFVRYNLRLRQIDVVKKEQDSLDPISIDGFSFLEDWVVGKEICLEDYNNSDWMELETLSANKMLLGHSHDEFEELGAGFDDYEIFNRGKE